MRLNKISIIGVGFMGGSLAIALKEVYPKIVLWGYVHTKKSFNKLKKLKAVDVVSNDLKTTVSDSDVIILAAPVFTIAAYFKKIASIIKEGAVIIDLGSTKELIENKAKKYLPRCVDFVGCHPLCGGNKHGPENAVRDLYNGAVCIITSRNKSVPFVSRLWNKLGCTVYRMNAITHDKILSYVSHLPHVISYSLTSVVPSRYHRFASSSFDYAVKVSSSSPSAWTDIFLSNRKHIAKSIDEYIRTLELFRDLIKSGDKKRITGLIKKINSKYNRYRL